jgi:S1-C subfamily serine protease
MNWLDLFIVVFLLAAVIRGVEIGFIRQFFSTAGFFLGLFVGAWVNGKLLHLAQAPDTKAFLTLTTMMAAAFGTMALGEYIGWILKFKVSDKPLANKLDRVFGSVLAGIALLAAIWLGAAIFRNVPNASWQKEIRTSSIVYILERHLPSAPSVLTTLGHLLDPNGFPQVFTGREPAPMADMPLPDMGEFNAAIETARASVVKIEGKGCGGIVEGSGFVASSREVITNAHVIAGVQEPMIVDAAGSHRATVVWFDPDLDMAVLRTSDLAGPPLVLHTPVANNGTAAAVLGYPGGGSLTAGGAAVLDSFTATGRNIYNQGETERAIYSLKATVQEGNSGGPLIDIEGRVIGVIFAKSTAYENVGYALTMEAVINGLNQAKHTVRGVSTGSCTQ